jgi:predicted dehydrogenase
MSTRIGLIGLDSSHAEDFLRHFNLEGRHAGIRITALWGGEPERIEALRQLSGEAIVAASIDDLVGSVDAVIVGDRHGDLHKEHALPAIEAGRPVFVDKPLANCLIDAEAIVSAAERRAVPLLSGSALRWQAETTRLKALLAGLPSPFQVEAYGTWYPQNDYGGAIFYAIHTVELAQELIGITWRDLALDGGTNPVIRYRADANTVSLTLQPLDESGHSSFSVRVRARDVMFDHSVPLGDDYMAPVAAQIAAMLNTGRSPMSREELLAPVAMMEEIDALLRT